MSYACQCRSYWADFIKRRNADITNSFENYFAGLLTIYLVFEAAWRHRRTPGPSAASPMNSMPASSSVERMRRRLAWVALFKPPSVSSLLIVLTLTDDFRERVAMLHPSAARDIRI